MSTNKLYYCVIFFCNKVRQFFFAVSASTKKLSHRVAVFCSKRKYKKIVASCYFFSGGKCTYDLLTTEAKKQITRWYDFFTRIYCKKKYLNYNITPRDPIFHPHPQHWEAPSHIPHPPAARPKKRANGVHRTYEAHLQHAVCFIKDPESHMLQSEPLQSQVFGQTPWGADGHLKALQGAAGDVPEGA